MIEFCLWFSLRPQDMMIMEHLTKTRDLQRTLQLHPLPLHPKSNHRLPLFLAHSLLLILKFRKSQGYIGFIRHGCTSKRCVSMCTEMTIWVHTENCQKH